MADNPEIGGERENEKALSPTEVAEKVQKEVQNILLEQYDQKVQLCTHSVEYFAQMIQNNKRSDKPSLGWQHRLEFDRHKDLVEMWTAKVLFWIAQDPSQTSIRWKEIPPKELSTEEQRAEIARTALNIFQNNKHVLEEALKKRLTGNPVTESVWGNVSGKFRVDILLWRVDEVNRVNQEKQSESQDMKDAHEAWETIDRAKHFPDTFHYDPSDAKSKARYVRIFRDGNVTKRVTFVPPNPFVIFPAGSAFNFKVHTVDDNDPMKIKSTSTLTIPFASAQETYGKDVQGQGALIRNLLTTPLEDRGLFAVLNVINYFQFYGTTKSDAEGVAHFPFVITKLYEDRVINHHFFLERLFDLLWSKQEEGITAEECTSITSWFKNNHDLFTEATPENIEEFMEGDKALAEKGVLQNEDGVYRIPHATNLKGPLLLKYACKEGYGRWLCRWEPKRNIGESEQAFEQRRDQPPRWARVGIQRYKWGTGDVVVGNHKVILDHLVMRLQHMRDGRWEDIIDFAQRLVFDLDHEKAGELDRGMNFFNMLVYDGLLLKKDGTSTFRDLCRRRHLYSFEKDTGVWSLDHSLFQFKFDPREGWLWGVTDKNQLKVEDILEYKEGLERREWHPLRIDPSSILVDRRSGASLARGTSAVVVYNANVREMRRHAAPPKKAPQRKQQ